MSDAPRLIRIKVNGNIPGFPAGGTYNVEAAPDGVPLSELWRRRLKDAETDNCCEVVPPEASDPQERVRDLAEIDPVEEDEES